VNRPVVLVLLAVAVSVVAAMVLSLRFSEAALLFALVAGASAPVVVHRVRSRALSLGLLTGLALFASFPAKKLYGVFVTYGTFGELAVTLAFLAVLFLVGAGWRRDWTSGPL
jgi:hypothetical protein